MKDRADGPYFFRAWMSAGIGEPIRKTMFDQMERFWEGQRRLVDEFESFSHAMLHRRRMAAEAALDTLHKMSSTTDSSEWAQSVGTWISESSYRLAEDSRAIVDESWKIFSGVSEMMSNGIAETAKSASEVQQTAVKAATEQAQALGEQGAASAQEAARLAAARASQRPSKRPEEGAKS